MPPPTSPSRILHHLGGVLDKRRLKKGVVPLTVVVIGSTGFTGRHVTIELLNRGHTVVGIARTPTAIGKRDNYKPIKIDILSGQTAELGSIFSQADVVVKYVLISVWTGRVQAHTSSSAFGPHFGTDISYKFYMEAVRQVLLAFKLATRRRPFERPYLIVIGGTGSLIMPGTGGVNVVDYDPFWLDYVRSISRSAVHVAYCKEINRTFGEMMENYREILMKGERANEDQFEQMKRYEEAMTNMDHDFVRACCTSYLFYDGNESFDWTFISPPAMYCPGKRTGEYDVHMQDSLPLPAEEGDVLPGISASDMAIVIADEAERKGMKWKHWTATADQSDDRLVPTYPTI
ncbi:hypothetical protein V1520DRAFT_344193 [Lipomyces starkeyi]|uniref:NAD-dependent epimerase/dehydratase domain-containing protein n=1 Tax=Lipomyces starkeyi NRRL Y-11557 TaxID=675824 RepID=A0A1E3PVU5_LIPST|nr:hypothetical protein LIPSTDRAFT_6730 [Lipomyces starkeyi NRRL Y-11557]